MRGGMREHISQFSLNPGYILLGMLPRSLGRCCLVGCYHRLYRSHAVAIFSPADDGNVLHESGDVGPGKPMGCSPYIGARPGFTTGGKSLGEAGSPVRRCLGDGSPLSSHHLALPALGNGMLAPLAQLTTGMALVLAWLDAGSLPLVDA